MYLLVFITMVISLIGIYTQTFALQTARLMSHQTGVANSMLAWHAAAVSMAASITRTNTNATGYSPIVQASGCSLTYNSIVVAPPAGGYPLPCPPPVGAGIPASEIFGTVTTTPAGTGLNWVINAKTGAAEKVHLPADYDPTTYQFYSILYKNGGINWVATFVGPPLVTTPPPGFVTLPSLPAGASLGITASDLFQQLQNTGIPAYTYGGVTSAAGVTQMVLQAGFTYTFPSDSIPNGAVAVVASPDGF